MTLFELKRFSIRWNMLRLASLLITLVSFGGCDAAVSEIDPVFLFAKAEAAVAFAEAEVMRHLPDADPKTCDACRGTGEVPSGDGLAQVPCPCGADCQCKPQSDAPVSQERKRRVLYFTADWCVHCRKNEATLAALADAGWKIGPGADNHIQLVEFDDVPDLRKRFHINTLPAWILIDDPHEVRRRYGVLDPFAVGRLFDNASDK